MRFINDRQRRAVFAAMGNKFSFPSEAVLSTTPKYVYNELSMKSDLEGIIKNLRKVEVSDKYPVDLKERARIEREKTEKLVAEKFKDKEDLSVDDISKSNVVILTPKPEFDAGKEYEKLDEFLKKEGRDVGGYYAGTSLAKYVPDPGVPSPAQEAAIEESDFREKVYKGLIKIVPKFKKGDDFSRDGSKSADGDAVQDKCSDGADGDKKGQLKLGVTADGRLIASDREIINDTNCTKSKYQTVLDK